MQAIRDQDGILQWVSSEPSPEMVADAVRIRVFATAVNRADLMQRKGHYPPPPGVTDILGLECSGEVVEINSASSSLKIGDRVCALLSGGGYADEVVVPEGQVLPIPKGYSMEQAAAVPEVFGTAWLNLRLEGMLKPEERVLMHAGASGVGTAVVQLCSAWGNPVAVSLGGEEKGRRLLELGAHLAADRHQTDMWDRLGAEGNFDLIIDPVGGDYLEPNVRLLNPLGRLVNIGLMSGSEGTLPLGLLLVKRLTVKGSVLRSRSLEEKARVMEGLCSEVWPLLESERVAPIIDSVLPIEQAQKAHERVAANLTIGKVVLRIRES